LHALQGPLSVPLRRTCNALLPLAFGQSAASVSCLSPVHYRRGAPRPVSYYALLKWWLLLSQHPGCPRSPTSLRTEHDSGTLAGGLGCSPLDGEAYPPPSSCPTLYTGIRSLVPTGSRVGPRSDSVALPPGPTRRTLTLKLFRRERAISTFG
jgi:hypothetical protein